MTANDPGTPGFPSKTPPLKDYRAITACFEALPGRIIPVDLASVRTTAAVLTPPGGFTEPPCNIPPGKPELFSVHHYKSSSGVDIEGTMDDTGPICKAYPCYLVVRGKHFFDQTPTAANLPIVSLRLPNNPQPGVTAPSATQVQVLDANHASEVDFGIEYDWVRTVVDFWLGFE
jgi:hypothetical protein